MANVIYPGTQYRLRAGAPMPVGSRRFILHTFMAEKNDVDLILYTETLPGSDQFRGQGGTYMSANFSRLANIGGQSFSGKIVHDVEYIEEDAI